MPPGPRPSTRWWPTRGTRPSSPASARGWWPPPRRSGRSCRSPEVLREAAQAPLQVLALLPREGGREIHDHRLHEPVALGDAPRVVGRAVAIGIDGDAPKPRLGFGERRAGAD